MNEINIIIEKLEFFAKQKKRVHIIFLNGNFSNCDILTFFSNAIAVEDILMGKRLIYYCEIKEIFEYKTRTEINRCKNE